MHIDATRELSEFIMSKKKSRFNVWFKGRPEPTEMSEKRVLYLIKQGKGHTISRYKRLEELPVSSILTNPSSKGRTSGGKLDN